MNAFVLVAAAVALFALAQKQKNNQGAAPAKPELPSPFPDKPKPPSEQPIAPPAQNLPSNIREPNPQELAIAAWKKNYTYYDLGDELPGGQWYKLRIGTELWGQSGGTFRFADLAVAIEQGFYIVARDAGNPSLKPRQGFPWKYFAISQREPMILLVEDAFDPRWSLACASGEVPAGKWIHVTSTGLRRVRDALGVA